MRILHVIGSVDPRGGGPISGLTARGLLLAQWDHTVEVASCDGPDEPFVCGFPLAIHALGPPRSKYGYSSNLVAWLLENIPKFDAVVVNGIWQYHSFAVWRASRGSGVPYYVFPHGMLDPWFKRAYPRKHLKKSLYWVAVESRVLRDARRVLFTCEEERRLASQSFWPYRVRPAVVNYGTAGAPDGFEEWSKEFVGAFPEVASKRVVLFLSRLHEKKGADLAIKAFGEVLRDQPEFHLVIAGPSEGGYRETLERLVTNEGLGDRVLFTGMLAGSLKWGAFAAAEAFLLPSHQENFGISVAEALSCGVPVLISDQVNIWREIEEAGAGLVGPDTLAGTAEVLRKWLSLDALQRSAMGSLARNLFLERFTVERSASSLLECLSGSMAVG